MILELLSHQNFAPSPAEIKQNYPLSDKLKALKKERDAAISAVITGADSRFLVIIGPCSADNEDSVCDYVSRLTSIQEDVADKLILIPRVYTNKPQAKVIRVLPHSRTRKKRRT